VAAPVKTDFSRVARAYRWMEYASFGTLLERTRYHRLPAMDHASVALVLGDGDGRFLQRLLATYPGIEVDAVDSSPGMVKLAKERAAQVAASGHVRWLLQDALAWRPARQYDLIVTHFFLDCFSSDEVAALIQKLTPSLVPGGIWINSDFAIPQSRWARLPGWCIIRGLYAAFYLLAGLRTQQLPDDTSAFVQAGMKLNDSRRMAAGLLKSEVWTNP
jgi:cyclopropane fatty-acyl-phospholipid synthase-like methyltransferase